MPHYVSYDGTVLVEGSLASAILPLVDTLSLSDVILKRTFELLAVWENDDTNTVGLVVVELSNVAFAIGPGELAFALFNIVLERSDICSAVGPLLCSPSVSLSILIFTSVFAPIRPRKYSLSACRVLRKLANIGRTIWN